MTFCKEYIFQSILSKHLIPLWLFWAHTRTYDASFVAYLVVYKNTVLNHFNAEEVPYLDPLKKLNECSRGSEFEMKPTKQTFPNKQPVGITIDERPRRNLVWPMKASHITTMWAHPQVDFYWSDLVTRCWLSRRPQLRAVPYAMNIQPDRYLSQHTFHPTTRGMGTNKTQKYPIWKWNGAATKPYQNKKVLQRKAVYPPCHQLKSYLVNSEHSIGKELLYDYLLTTEYHREIAPIQ